MPRFPHRRPKPLSAPLRSSLAGAAVTGVAAAVAIAAVGALAWPIMHVSEQELEAAQAQRCLIPDARGCAKAAAGGRASR